MKTITTFLTLAMTAMIAAAGCTDEGTTAEEDTSIDETEETIGTVVDDTPGDFEAAARSAQHDCGILTCTIRLNRAWTKKAQSSSGVASVASTACSLLPAAVLVCKAAIKLGGVVLSNRAKTYYADGDCLGIRYNRSAQIPGTPAAAWPVRVTKNSYNCQ
jgi:hypothetical protein